VTGLPRLGPWGPVAVPLALGAVLLLPRLGQAPIERAEVYFMDAARAMVEQGDYLVPRYRHEPFYDKPPLTYWLMAGSFRLFGFGTGAARLVAVAAALGLLAVTARLGFLLFDRRTAAASALVLATTVAFMTFGRVAMSDMLLALWTNLALAVALAGWRPDPPRLFPAVLGAVLGLGFMTKGPVGVLFPGLGLLLLAAWRRAERPRLHASAVLAGASSFAVVGLSWFVAVLVREGPGPLVYFFLRENLERFAGEAYDAGRPWWFYIGAYLVVGLPWSPFLPAAAVRALRTPSAAPARFLLGWVALMLVPLSLSRGKIDYYLLPLYPAASLVVGRWLAGLPLERRDRGAVRAALLLLAAATALAPLTVGRIPERWLPGPWAHAAAAGAAATAALALCAAALRPTPRRVLVTVAGTAAMLFLGAVLVFLPAFRDAQPNEAILADVLRERRYRPDAAMVLCHDAPRVQRDILFHARLAVEERCDVWAPASSRAPFLLLLQPEERQSLEAGPGFRVVSEHQALSGRDLTLRGLLRGPRPEGVVLAANFDTDDPVAETKRKKERKRALRQAEEGDREGSGGP